LKNVAGIVDPGHNLYSKSDGCVAFGLCRHKRIGFLSPPEPEKLLPQRNQQENRNSSASLRRQKTWRVLAAVSALPSRNTFVRLPKRRCRTDVETKNPKPKGKIHETQPQQIRGRFALRICGHYLLAHDVGDYPRARRSGGYR
jgi:hypothetical protein